MKIIERLKTNHINILLTFLNILKKNSNVMSGFLCFLNMFFSKYEKYSGISLCDIESQVRLTEKLRKYFFIVAIYLQ